MIACARVAASGSRLVGLRSQPPVALRATPEGVFLVGSSAGPLGGDVVTIEIDATDDADLTIRTPAAAVVLPGSAPSVLRVRAHVASGASLCWHPEPTVLAQGCRHDVDMQVELDEGARLEWWDDLVLGRHGETSGSVTSRLTIDLGGRPLLRHELALGPEHPASAGPAVAGTARAVGSVVIVDPSLGAATPTVLGPDAVAMPLDGPAVHVVTIGRVACRLDVEGARLALHR